MASLTGVSQGIFDTVHLINSNQDLVEVRDLFLSGSIKQSVPANPLSSDVLSIPGLLPQLSAKQDVANSYSKTEVDNIIATNPGPKGEKGASVTGPKGDVGTVGSKGNKGLNLEIPPLVCPRILVTLAFSSTAVELVRASFRLSLMLSL